MFVLFDAISISIQLPTRLADLGPQIYGFYSGSKLATWKNELDTIGSISARLHPSARTFSCHGQEHMFAVFTFAEHGHIPID